MLTCHACMRRSLQSLTRDSSSSASAFTGALTTAYNRRRNYSSVSSQRLNSLDRKRTRSAVSYRQYAVPVASKWQDKVTSRTIRRQQWLQSRGIRPESKPPTPEAEIDRSVRKELQYLKDPLVLADHVRQYLREDEFDKTLALVRAASKDVQCTVSWNHLIDYELSKGRMNAAIKTYNEVRSSRVCSNAPY